MELIVAGAAVAALAGIVLRRARAVQERQMPPGHLRTSWKYVWRRIEHCPDTGCEGRGGVRSARSSTGMSECGRCRLRIAEHHDDYSSWLTREHFLTEGGHAAPLTSSLLKGGQGDGMHAPALDLDFPIEGDLGPEGGIVRLRRKVEPKAWSRVLSVMDGFGLTDTAWAKAEIARLDAMEPEFRGYREPSVSEVDPQVRFCCSGNIVPSTTMGHHHLYLDRALSWERYVELLEALADAEIIERPFLEMSRHRRMTLLRKPGVRKSASGLDEELFGRAWRFE